MSKEKLGQEPAYPEFEKDSKGETLFVSGMSKRFYAACAAMQGLLAIQNIEEMKYSFEQIIPKLAFMYADELLKQENE